VRALVAALFVWAAIAPRAAADAEAGWLLEDPGLRMLTPADLAARPARFPFPVGERMVYAVSWFGVPAGTATVEVARYAALGDVRIAHVVATADTNPVFSLVYPLHDRSEAWIDLDRAVTLRTRAVERRGEKHYDETVVYDWGTHFLHARLDKLHKGQRREVAFDFGPFAHDTSDAVFALRALPLAPGFTAGLPTYANRKLFEFRIEVEPGRRLERTPFGDVETLAVRPSTWLDGAEHAAGEGVVLVAGPARVPVRLEGWIRTTESNFLARGLRAVLIEYTASAPGWPPAHAPSLDATAPMPPTRDGVPQWDPPPPIRAARTAARILAGERFSRFTPPPPP
jgi:hypothetical protein